jgi:hypothetical protein
MRGNFNNSLFGTVQTASQSEGRALVIIGRVLIGLLIPEAGPP